MTGRALRFRGLGWMLGLCVVLAVTARAQVTTTTVQGTIYRADGTAAQGTVIVNWPAFATAANQAVAAGSTTATIGVDGFLSLNLAPNAGAYPAGTYYTAVYHLDDGSVSKEYWVVPAATTAAISSIRAALAPATVAVQAVSKDYVDTSIAAITGQYLPLTGGAMTGALLLNGDPLSGTQAATKHYADTLAAALVPLAGATMSGALNTPNAITKLPRVDVRHPDFGSGCANAADPTGTLDSTCAIAAAVAYAQSVSANGQTPTVYFPGGTYRISSALRLPCALHYVGDGPSATTIEQAGNAANAVTVYEGGSLLDGQLCAGSLQEMQITTSGSHLHTADLVELDSVPGFKLNRLRLYNSGGRGLQLNGSSERVESNDLQIDSVRWPLVLTTNTNEDHFFKTNIESPGIASDGYCWGNNCPNGAFPAYGWTVAQKLVSASGNGSTLTVVVQGGTDTGSTNGNSPLGAGHWFELTGVANVSAMNGFWQVTSVANNSPASGEYTLTASSAANGSATVTGASFLPAILPENHSAVWMAAVDVGFFGGSIKALYAEGGFQAFNSEANQITNFYLEGFPINGQPHMNAGVTVGGLLPQTTLGGSLAAGSLTVAASGMWFPDYYNDPADAQAASCISYVMIAPKDFAWGSTTASAYASGVQQGQYEIACVKGFAGDGNLYLATRQVSTVGGYATTAPAATMWPAGSLVELITQSTSYGNGLLVSATHFNAIDPPGANWAADCNDSSALTCSDIIAGNIPDNVGIATPGGAGTTGTIAQISLLNDSLFFGSPEMYGAGFLKVHSSAEVTVLGSGSMASSTGETSEVTNGQFLNGGGPPFVMAVTYPTGSSAWVSYANPAAGIIANSIGGPFFEGMVNGYSTQAVNLGANPGGNYALGHQFASSSCWYDVGPSSSSTHAQNRFCMKGGPNLTGSLAGWEYDVWNGTAWVGAFSLAAQGATANATVSGTEEVQGALSAAAINGEITVDGATYASVNAAWAAALSAASASGKNQTVRLGPGSFAVSTTLNEPTNGACVNLIGSGGTTVNAGSTVATTLTVPASLGGDVIYLGNTTQAQGCTFKDFVILAATNATHGFEMQWFRGLLIDNVTVNDTTAEGVLLGEESTTAGHQANFLLRNVTVSYNASLFTPATRPAYGVHIQKTAIDSHLDDITVRNALTASVFNEGTGNTGYLIHGFGYPYTCTTAPCSNTATTSTAANASYATNYVIEDTGGGGSIWTDAYLDSPAIAGFYIGADGVAAHGGHIQWPDLTSFPNANLAYVAAGVTNNLMLANIDCLGMNTAVNWITYAGTSGNPPTFSTVHGLTGCGNYVQALNPEEVSGFSSGGANINDPSGAVPRVWSTPIAAASSYPAFVAQLYTGYEGDVIQGHFSGVTPFFNVTYQGTIKSTGGIALGTVLNTASTLTLTNANKNVIANAASGAQTITLPSCYTAWPDKAAPTGLEFTIIKSDTSANAVTLATVSSQTINYAGTAAATLAISAAGKRTLVCGPDYNWYAY
ncbi:glycosyl hydrolase family 28-related protein [Silvibacterium sp.]|uniref:glycosyl hydrolase family 28-related protein n=1 Tax=Silvibacterium sp. TaxID=1964179 RepID=UPI0039E2AFF1